MNVSDRSKDLDFLRGLAILLAMGWHINHYYSSDNFLVNLMLYPGRTFGWAGVDLFFVLSGFLVGGLIFREISKTGGINLTRFFIRRVYRLWPVLYIFLFAMALSGVTPIENFFWQIALHVQNYFPTKSATHLWSLAVEEHFYILLSVSLFFFLKSKRGLNPIPALVVAIFCLCLLGRFIAANFGVDSQSLQIKTHFRLDGLSLGVLLAYLSIHHSKLFKRLSEKKTLWFFVTCISIIFVSTVSKATYLGSTLGYSVSAVGCASALLLVFNSNLTAKIGLIAVSISYIGLVAYPLYLWHVPVTKVLKKLNTFDDVWFIFIAYFLSIAVSFIMTFMVERPIMKLRDKRSPSPVAPVKPTG